MEKNLTQLQFMFIERFLIHGNATKAAIEAGYSEDSAASIGAENLRKPEIRQSIQLKKDDLSSNCLIGKLQILNELSRYAFQDHPDAYKDVKPRERISALSKISEFLGFTQTAEDIARTKYEELLLKEAEEKAKREKEKREKLNRQFPTVAHL